MSSVVFCAGLCVSALQTSSLTWKPSIYLSAATCWTWGSLTCILSRYGKKHGSFRSSRLQITAGHRTYVRQKWPFALQSQTMDGLKNGYFSCRHFHICSKYLSYLLEDKSETIIPQSILKVPLNNWRRQRERRPFFLWELPSIFL